MSKNETLIFIHIGYISIHITCLLPKMRTEALINEFAIFKYILSVMRLLLKMRIEQLITKIANIKHLLILHFVKYKPFLLKKEIA